MWDNLEEVPFIPKPILVASTSNSELLSTFNLPFYSNVDTNTKFCATKNDGGIMAKSPLEIIMDDLKDLDPVGIKKCAMRLRELLQTDYEVPMRKKSLTDDEENAQDDRDTEASTQRIILKILPEEEKHHPMGKEGYRIIIAKHCTTLLALTACGLFYSIQTFRQILPPTWTDYLSYNDDDYLLIRNKFDHFAIPTGTIYDRPEFAFRSTMLDVVRHFFSLETLKRHIRNMSMFKINHLHLHLSDDQGWRIQIKSWPNLTLIGSLSEVGGLHQEGQDPWFYSQEQYREIIEFAQDHYITIIPEIEMPGHTNAALASYADLNTDGNAKQLYTGRNVGFSSLDTEKEITYQFIQDVIGEVASLTDGPYIHIGGDESMATPKEGYSDFIAKVQRIVEENGKIMIGWEEILSSNELNPSTSVVQIWKTKSKNILKEKKKLNRSYILSPADKVYMDMKYNASTPIGLTWAGFISVQVSYDWKIKDILRREGITKTDIVLGVEAPLWCETITTANDIDFMVFPRLLSLAEISWTASTNRSSWEDYKVRLGKHKKQLEALRINYYPSPDIPWTNEIGKL